MDIGDNIAQSVANGGTCEADGKTVLTMRQLHPSRERRRAVIGFGAVEYGLQTLDGLAA